MSRPQSTLMERKGKTELDEIKKVIDIKREENQKKGDKIRQWKGKIHKELSETLKAMRQELNKKEPDFSLLSELRKKCDEVTALNAFVYKIQK